MQQLQQQSRISKATFSDEEALQKAKTWLNASVPEQVVPQQPAPDVYLVIKQLGTGDSLDLLPNLSQEQLLFCLDMDLWQRDRLDADTALAWLQQLWDADMDQAWRALQQLDFHLLVLLLKKLVTIEQGLEAFTDEALADGSYQNGDIYVCSYPDSESGKMLEQLLRRFRDEDMNFYLHLMETVQWEQLSSLEEEAWQWRNRRLEEYGFCSFTEAQALFAVCSREQLLQQEKKTKEILPPGSEPAPPQFALQQVAPGHLLGQVLAAGLPQQELYWELYYLLNKALCSQGQPWESMEQFTNQLQEMYQYLNLGLEHLCGQDVHQAQQCLQHWYLQQLFQLGFNLTMELKGQAQQVQETAIMPYLDGPYRAFLQGLLQARPRLYLGVYEDSAGGYRGFAETADLKAAQTWLQRLTCLHRLFCEHLPIQLPQPDSWDLSGCIPDAAADVTLSDIFLTALANRVLGRGFVLQPVDAADLPALHARICQQGSVDDRLREESLAWLEQMVPHSSFFVDECLQVWQEEFCAVAAAQLDPRFVGGLICRYPPGS